MFRRLFRKKPKPPLVLAREYLYRATEIAWTYRHDTTHLPTAEEISDMHLLCKHGWETYGAFDYIYRLLLERCARTR